MDQGSTLQQLPTQTTDSELGAPQQPPKLELKAHGPAQRHSQQKRQPALQRSLTGTVNHWSAQRYPCGGDNRPGGARLQHAKLRDTPRSMATTKGPPDLDARPSGRCIHGAITYVPRVGPATLSVTHCSRDNSQAEDDLCPVRLGYTPLRPLYPQRQNYAAWAGPATLTTVKTTG
jgi:hypothetical protein